jgi:micrococcal nuclease
MGKKSFAGQKVWVVLFSASLILNFYLLLEKNLLGLWPSREKTTFKARVVRVVDGDTLDIESPPSPKALRTEEEKRIRLAGIDAPEYPEGCLAQEAKDRLEELVLGREIEIEEVEKDNFGRSLAFVFIDEELVNRVLIEEGLAGVYKDDSRYGPLLLGRQEEAKKAQRGIWSSLCLPPEGCLIKGNVRKDRGTKVYHLPGCFNYEKTVVNEKEGDRWFCSEEEAKAAGFVKSKDCPGAK